MVTFNKKIVELVELTKEHTSALIELSASVGWDYDEFEISTVLSSGKLFGHVNAEGKVVSSAAIFPYDTNLAWIGMVIVHQDLRGLGFGKQVTQKCIDFVSSYKSIMLIATEEGKPLYTKMGFKTVDYVHKYLCDQYIRSQSLSNSGLTIEEFRSEDFAELLSFDQAAFGDKRSIFLQNRIHQSEQCVVVKDKHSKMIGFGMSVQGPINLVLGPIVVPNSDIAAVVVDTLISRHSGKLRIDVPSGHEPFRMFLEQSGFKQVSQPPVMIINSDTMPPRNQTLFGIAAQTYG